LEVLAAQEDLATLNLALRSRRFAPALRVACLSLRALASSGDDRFLCDAGIPAGMVPQSPPDYASQVDMRISHESLLIVLSLR
jgi:hypothetical protein